MLKLSRSKFGNWRRGPSSRLHPTFTNDMMFGGGVSSYSIDYGLRFRAANSARLTRTFGTPTNNLKWKWRATVKRGTLGTYQVLFTGDDGAGTNLAALQFNVTTNKLQFAQLAGGYNVNCTTDAAWTDPNAHYDIELIYDSANATAADRIIIKVNGVRQALTYTTGPFAQNTASQINVNGRNHAIGYQPYSAAGYFDGIMSNVAFIDGSISDTFNEISSATGQLVQKRPAVAAYGANGSLNEFKNATSTTTIGYDTSPSASNHWTTSGISVTSGVTFDQSSDTPTNTYAVYNPLYNMPSYPTTFSNANTSCSRAGATGAAAGVSSIGVTSGLWYGEFTLASIGTAVLTRVGVTATSKLNSSLHVVGGEFDAYGTGCNGVGYFANGTRRTSSGDTASWAASYTTNDVIMVAFDASTGKVWFGKNGTWLASGDPAAGTSPAATLTTGVPFYFTHQLLDSQWHGNFGQRPFAYTPPAGFKALCTANLSTPALPNPARGMNTRAYAGNSGTQTIATDFQFDLAIIKCRNVGRGWRWMDSIRGFNNVLSSSDTSAEYAGSAVSSVSPTGVDLINADNSNVSGENYALYGFLRGATPGFDIVTYTGNGTNRTVSHAASAKPKLIVTRSRGATSTGRWCVQHALYGAARYAYLNETFAFDTTNASQRWNSTDPTSSVFSLGTSSDVNHTGDTYIAYLWAEVEGFSKIDSYRGNGSADGAFVDCGFKPALVMIFDASNGGINWRVWDDARSPSNVASLAIYPNSTGTEGTEAFLDFTSNGFKVRDSGTIGVSGREYIYAAFARSPFKYATAR